MLLLMKESTLSITKFILFSLLKDIKIMLLCVMFLLYYRPLLLVDNDEISCIKRKHVILITYNFVERDITLWGAQYIQHANSYTERTFSKDTIV